jgi:hypothetical protein
MTSVATEQVESRDHKKLRLRIDRKPKDATQLHALLSPIAFPGYHQNFDSTEQSQQHPNAYTTLQTMPNLSFAIQSRIDIKWLSILCLQPLAIKCVYKPIV